MYVCMYVYMYMCVCMRVCVGMYMDVCVCVRVHRFVCERAYACENYLCMESTLIIMRE